MSVVQTCGETSPATFPKVIGMRRDTNPFDHLDFWGRDGQNTSRLSQERCRNADTTDAQAKIHALNPANP